MAKYTIEEIKKKTWKPMNGFFEVLVLDRTTIYLVWLLANFTKVTPNQVSLFGALFIPITTYLFWKNYFILGAISLILIMSFDATDGKLARLTNNMSKVGIVYEGTSDLLRIFLPITGLAFGYYNIIEDITIFFWALLSLFTIYFFIFLGLFTLYKTKLAEENPKLKVIGTDKKIGNKITEIGVLGRIKKWLNSKRLELQFMITEQELTYFVLFPVLAHFFGAEFIKYGFIVGSCVMLLWLIVKYSVYIKRNRNIKYVRIE